MNEKHDWNEKHEWLVLLQRKSERPISVEFAEAYDKNGDSAEYGYEDDFVLGSLIGMAIKAVTPGDDQPWRLAVVCNLLDYLGRFDASPEMVRLQKAAREVWESLSSS